MDACQGSEFDFVILTLGMHCAVPPWATRHNAARALRLPHSSALRSLHQLSFALLRSTVRANRDLRLGFVKAGRMAWKLLPKLCGSAWGCSKTKVQLNSKSPKT